MEKITVKDHIYFTESIIKALFQNRILTLVDFLQEDAVKLSTLTKLGLPQIFDIRRDIFANYSAPAVNGINLFAHRLTSKKYVSTEIESLDKIFSEGIQVGFITEVCGLAGSGKTQLCMQLAVNCAKCSNSVVLYIDTKGDFSALRIQQILDARGFSHKDMATAMLKIKIVHIWHMKDLIKLFEELKTGNIVIPNLSLILIDSLPCLMLQHFGDDNKLGLQYLNNFVNYARYLSKELKLGLLCVNIQTRWIDQENLDIEEQEHSNIITKESAIEKWNRCLGKYWKHIPAVVIYLEKCQDSVTNTINLKLTLTSYNAPDLRKTCIIENSLLGIS